MNLTELGNNHIGRIKSVGGEGALRQHFLDMGIIPGTTIKYMKTAPMGDPIQYQLWGYELTLRKDDALKIDIELIEEDDALNEKDKAKGDNSNAKHPGLGEMGIFHVNQKGQKLDEDELITFGLSGNQNCGKTTLFNQLTGSNQHVGNFPGDPVDRKDGAIKEK